jgi:hypothetical protein
MQEYFITPDETMRIYNARLQHEFNMNLILESRDYILARYWASHLELWN